MDNVVLIFIAIFVTFAINAVPDKVLSPAAKYIVTSKADTILQYCKDHDISLQDVVFVDDVISFLREAERKGIESFHISSFLDWDFERR